MSVNSSDNAGGRGVERTAPRETSPGNHGISRSAGDAYKSGASAHHEAMTNSRNNAAADHALPKMQVASSDTRGSQAGVKIKEGKDGTDVSYKDGSNYKTKGDTTTYDNGSTTGKSVQGDGFNYNGISRKNSELSTEEIDTKGAHSTTNSYKGQVQGTELTDKQTGASSYKEKVPPKDWKEPGYSPDTYKDFYQDFGNRRNT